MPEASPDDSKVAGEGNAEQMRGTGPRDKSDRPRTEVGVQIGGLARGYQELFTPLAIPATAEQTRGRARIFMQRRAWRECLRISSAFDQSLLTWDDAVAVTAAELEVAVAGAEWLDPAAVPGRQFHGIPSIEGHLKTQVLAEEPDGCIFLIGMNIS